MEEEKQWWDIDAILVKPKLTHDKCPACRKIHGKKIKGTRNTYCGLKCWIDSGNSSLFS